MTLAQYLKNRRMTVRDFAAASGISPATVHRIAAGRNARWPSLEAVIRATNGKVGFADMRPTVNGK